MNLADTRLAIRAVLGDELADEAEAQLVAAARARVQKFAATPLGEALKRQQLEHPELQVEEKVIGALRDIIGRNSGVRK